MTCRNWYGSPTWFKSAVIREVCDLRVGGHGGGAIDTTNTSNPDGRVALTYTHDANSRLTSITDDRGNPTSLGYDEMDRQVTRTNADGRTFVSVYDRDDNVA